MTGVADARWGRFFPRRARAAGVLSRAIGASPAAHAIGQPAGAPGLTVPGGLARALDDAARAAGVVVSAGPDGRIVVRVAGRSFEVSTDDLLDAAPEATDLLARARAHAAVRHISRLTNHTLAGASATVVGSGPVARAVAGVLRRTGARVDHRHGLEALFDAAAPGDLLVLTGEHAGLRPDALPATARPVVAADVGEASGWTSRPTGAPARPGVERLRPGLHALEPLPHDEPSLAGTRDDVLGALALLLVAAAAAGPWQPRVAALAGEVLR